MSGRSKSAVINQAIEIATHPIADPEYAKACRTQFESDGALVLRDFFSADAIESICRESEGREGEAFYAGSSHNVYLTALDSSLPVDHAFNRQVESSKGLLADDQVPADSILRSIYGDPHFRAFLCEVLGIEEIHPYGDELSSINVHFAAAGQELGWHFDNSSFAVTMLLRAPEGGGLFQYVPGVRRLTESGDPSSDGYRAEYEAIDAVLDGCVPVMQLNFDPGDLVLFRGRTALHRVTPTEGDVTRMLVVFAYNDQPGIALSESALKTFYGRSPNESPTI